MTSPLAPSVKEKPTIKPLSFKFTPDLAALEESARSKALSLGWFDGFTCAIKWEVVRLAREKQLATGNEALYREACENVIRRWPRSYGRVDWALTTSKRGVSRFVVRGPIVYGQ